MLWLLAFATVRVWVWYDRAQHLAEWYRPPPGQSSGLVVIVHGWTKGPQDMKQVAEVVGGMEEFQQHGIYLWAYESDRFSNMNPLGLANDLANKFDELHRQSNGDIILIGHSLGGLLLRRAFITGLDHEKEWSRAVRRIVLLAAPNRGTEATSRSPWLWMADGLSRSFGVGELIRSTYRGAPFIVDLRIDWIRRFQTLKNPPLVAQIVGAKDDVVSSSDSLDVLQFPNTIDRHLLNSTHASVTRSEESGTYVREVLRASQGDHKGVDSGKQAAVLKLLLVHGIRDYGERFDEIRDAVKALASQQNITLQTSAPRYRYFSALQFVNPISRRHKIYEFADLYAEMLATPPIDAPIYFVGHSFGTYLMGKSVQEYKSFKIERAYLAGTVLHENFFAKHKNELGGRIRYLRNDIATADWPVGILCSGVDGLGMAEDVGTGGFNGFAGVVNEDQIEEMKFFDGGHGKALELTNRPTIAAWLLQGRGVTYDRARLKDMLNQAQILVKSRSFGWGLASRAAPGLFVLIFALMAYLLLIGRRPLLALSEIILAMWLLNII